MVYVDPICKHGWQRGASCHLFADSFEELAAFALKIGLKAKWLQRSNTGLFHYDLLKTKRRLAVKNGAKELTRRQAVDKWKQLENL